MFRGLALTALNDHATFAQTALAIPRGFLPIQKINIEAVFTVKRDLEGAPLHARASPRIKRKHRRTDFLDARFGGSHPQFLEPSDPRATPRIEEITAEPSIADVLPKHDGPVTDKSQAKPALAPPEFANIHTRKRSRLRKKLDRHTAIVNRGALTARREQHGRQQSSKKKEISRHASSKHTPPPPSIPLTFGTAG